MDFAKDFPFLEAQTTYLDSAATSHKPQVVIDAISHFYANEYGTVHRSVYDRSLHCTKLFESTREVIGALINCSSSEVLFCNGITDGINHLARAIGSSFLQPGDTICVTEMEHHSNLVPWHMLKEQSQLNIKVIPVKEDKHLDLSNVDFNGVKLLAITHVSNVSGIENPIKEICKKAHKHDTLVLVDGGQSTAHKKIDVQDLGCDFFVFSSHKIYGPTGVGAIFAKKELLDQLSFFDGGGNMIEKVYPTYSTYASSPFRFEAGTPPIAQVIGMKKALEYLLQIGMETIEENNQTLFTFLKQKLQSIQGIELFCDIPSASLLSFSIQNMHPLDIASYLNLKKIEIRSGHLCAQPYLRKFGKESLCRVSLGIYNCKEDVLRLIQGLEELVFVLN